jgi:exopolysaccharide production protein ExoQ
MPPVLALTISLAFIALLLVSERRMNPDVSHAVWIPLLWIFFIGTRFPSQWLDLASTGAMESADQYLEGSPVDQLVFLALYLAALVVLMRRRISIGTFISANVWVSVFLLYGFLSIAWSDYPWTAFKRFTKVIEHIVMVLVILTEANPRQAIDALLRRFLGVSLTLSVLFLKYYPEYGRGFNQWSGEAYNMGVTMDKNALGHLCLLGAAFYSSSLVFATHRAIGTAVRFRSLLDVVMLGAVFWLLAIADAKTALVCSMLAAASVVVMARTPLGHNPRAVLFSLVACVALIVLAEWIFDLRAMTISALDRDPTLTDRTYVWADVLAMPNNVLLGTGFESFWLGPRVELLWEKYWWRPNQAHNGYLETYINLGAIGVGLLVLMMVASLSKAVAWLAASDPFGPLRFALVLTIAIYNYTDATFKAVHILFFTFFLVSLSVVPARAFGGVTDTPPDTSPSPAQGGLTGP